jgi:hypothetical protein
MAAYNTVEPISGLRTTQMPNMNPGPHQFVGKLTLPRASQGSSGASQVVVTVNQNGSPVYVGIPGADGFETGVNIAVNDVITVVTSSNQPVDQVLNAVKLTVSIWEGGE